MSDVKAVVAAICFAALAVIGVAMIEHEHPECVRIASTIEIVGDCGRK